MGTGEDGTPSKNSKPEIPPSPYPDWTSSMQREKSASWQGGDFPERFLQEYDAPEYLLLIAFLPKPNLSLEITAQRRLKTSLEKTMTIDGALSDRDLIAYYGAGATPPPFFASTVASPTPHPYMWSSQHPLIPPYGTPVPYTAIYPPGGIYAHPSMAMTPGTVHTNTELEGKSPDGKDRASAKKVIGNAGSSGGKAGDGGKVASGSGNDGASQSADSGSEGSSDGSDENPNQREFPANKKGSFEQMLADGANAQSSGKPATNLNIGMDLWNTSSGSTKVRSNPSATSSTVVPATMIGREGAMPDQWIQDERELKRQKRKQSNRESARRSRLRKQAECEELQARVQTLSNENGTLRDELQRISEECEKLTSENNNMKEELTRLCGPEAMANLEQRGGEGDS